MKLILKLLISTASVMISAYLIPGVSITNFWAAGVFAVVFGILNVILKPILVIFTLPITVLTLGLFTLVINTVVILVASYFVTDLYIQNFVSALIFGIVLSLVNSFLSNIAD